MKIATFKIDFVRSLESGQSRVIAPMIVKIGSSREFVGKSEIKFEFDRDAEMAQRQLRQMEAELNRLFQWKPKSKTSVSAKIPKKTKAELRKEALADMPDLFDF